MKNNKDTLSNTISITNIFYVSFLFKINDIHNTLSARKAVAPLSELGRLGRFVRSKGQYNPKDAFGTFLKEYYNKF